jgi:pectate lyase
MHWFQSKYLVSLGLLAVGLVFAVSAMAGTLEVGAGKPYKTPSEAVAAAANGDRIVIAPGEYFDCAVVHQNNLVIEGSDPAGTAVMTDKTCQGKAILVTTGAGIIVRNLTLTRARVPDGNGAGIRAEGSSLTVEHVHFINNQDGILTGAPEGATLIVRDSEFLRNGGCQGACAHGIYAGHIALLRVEHTRFFETKEAHNIKSRALRTEVIGCDIADGPQGTSSYQVEIPNGGSVVVRGSTLEKGPKSGNHTAAIMIGSEGVTQPSREITIDNNSFRNDGNYPTVFVDNLTATEAQLKGNRLSGTVKPLQGDGQVD